jgi:hypothetical protein
VSPCPCHFGCIPLACIEGGGRQRRKLFHPPVEEGAAAGADQDRTNALLRKTREGRFEIAIGSGCHNNELQAQRARCRLQVCVDGWGIRKRWVRENAEPASIGYQIVEQLQSFRPQLAH